MNLKVGQKVLWLVNNIVTADSPSPLPYLVGTPEGHEIVEIKGNRVKIRKHIPGAPAHGKCKNFYTSPNDDRCSIGADFLAPLDATYQRMGGR